MIFLDNASTTQVSQECAKIATEYMTEKFFNPSAPYHPSVEASKDLNLFRESVRKSLKGDGKIIFTSSGSESDNLALFGVKKPNKSRIIVSMSEHPAVMRAAEELKMRGYDVVTAPVDENARVIPEKFAELVNKDTSLISIMHVNNETGAINDIKKLVNIAKDKNPSVLFHSDGVQAAGKIRVNLSDLGVDLYSTSGHKIYAPRGVGVLFIKKGVNIRPIIFGGGQEFNVRSSTENTAAIAAYEYALRTAVDDLEENCAKVKELSDYLKGELSKSQDDYHLITGGISSPYIINFAMKYVRGEVMLHSLEKYGIFVGTGSACSSKKIEKSLPTIAHLAPEYEKGILRVSLSINTTKDELDYFIKYLNLEYSKLQKYMRG